MKGHIVQFVQAVRLLLEEDGMNIRMLTFQHKGFIFEYGFKPVTTKTEKEII